MSWSQSVVVHILSFQTLKNLSCQDIFYDLIWLNVRGKITEYISFEQTMIHPSFNQDVLLHSLLVEVSNINVAEDKDTVVAIVVDVCVLGSNVTKGTMRTVKRLITIIIITAVVIHLRLACGSHLHGWDISSRELFEKNEVFYWWYYSADSSVQDFFFNGTTVDTSRRFFFLGILPSIITKLFPYCHIYYRIP